MKKPWWEETWVLDAKEPESGPVIGLEGGGVLFECNDATRARGAHAAPDMAKALRALGSVSWHKDALQWHLEACWPGVVNGRQCRQDCANARVALTKAGVPLP